MDKKVLIVDDSASIRRQVTNVLLAAGIETLEAVDGVDGAEQIRSNGNIALVLCDINMPRMNGLDMLESLTEELAARSLPVIVLTTEGEPAAIARAKRAGVKGWIVKPFKEPLLIGAVKKLTGM